MVRRGPVFLAFDRVLAALAKRDGIEPLTLCDSACAVALICCPLVSGEPDNALPSTSVAARRVSSSQPSDP